MNKGQLTEYLKLLPKGYYDLESIYKDWLEFVLTNDSIKTIPSLGKFKTISQNNFKWSRNSFGEYWGSHEWDDLSKMPNECLLCQVKSVSSSKITVS